METFAFIIAWLCAGYLWTMIYVHKILDNKRFADTGNEPGAFSLIMITVCGPIMAVIVGIFCLLHIVFHYAGPTIRRLFWLR